ncbi:MAG: hypothetical protein OXF46_01480 [Rhodobacteraceae bacterium]|nr:hypothetical protein [Paracoccaceae bacterium]
MLHGLFLPSAFARLLVWNRTSLQDITRRGRCVGGGMMLPPEPEPLDWSIRLIVVESVFIDVIREGIGSTTE